MSLILMLQIRYLNTVKLANDCSFWFAWLWTALYKQMEYAFLWFTGSEIDVIWNLYLGKYLDIVREEASAHLMLVTQAVCNFPTQPPETLQSSVCSALLVAFILQQLCDVLELILFWWCWHEAVAALDSLDLLNSSEWRFQ